MTKRLWPTRAQWAKWSLPSKLTVIGAYVGIAALIITLLIPLLQLPGSPIGNTIDPIVLPEAFLTVTIAPIRPNDYEAVWFLSSCWGLSLPADSASAEGWQNNVFQSTSAFRLILTSGLPPGYPEPIIESVGLCVLARRSWKPRIKVKTLLYMGGGADGPVSIADFERTLETYWPLRWRPSWSDQDHSQKPREMSFKYLKAGENIVILVSEAPRFLTDADDHITGEEAIVVAARMDLLIAGKKITVFSPERLLLLEYNHLMTDVNNHSYADVFDGFDYHNMESLQSSSMAERSISAVTEASDLPTMIMWKAHQEVFKLKEQPTCKRAVKNEIEILTLEPGLSLQDKTVLTELAHRLK